MHKQIRPPNELESWSGDWVFKHFGATSVILQTQLYLCVCVWGMNHHWHCFIIYHLQHIIFALVKYFVKIIVTTNLLFWIYL